jgi:ATP-dependent DNA helicase RecQ
MITEFESVYCTKFRTDLDEFIKESNYDDFYTDMGEAVYVSTIHKAKGREFDSVYLLLKNVSAPNDEEKRKLYVALTRAKESLYVHCNTDILRQYYIDGVIKTEDATEYDDPSEISLQLTHKDVVLDFFKDKKEIILKLRSGGQLEISGSFLSAEVNGRTVRIAKFSKGFAEKLENLKNKGYKPLGADIGYVVAWQGENEEDELAIILPILRLKQSCITEHNNDNKS